MLIRFACLAATASLLFTSGGVTHAQDQDDEATVSARVIELEAHAAIRFLDADGRETTDIAVVPGETVLFRIDNTAGFDFSFYIGTEQEFEGAWAETDVGIPAWTSGVRELVWVVPDDIGGLRFGSTVPGHPFPTSGTISEATERPEGPTVEIAGLPPMPDIDGWAELHPAVDGYLPDGGRIEIPWVGVAVQLPPGWSYSLGPEPRSWTMDFPLHVTYEASGREYGCSLSVDKAPGPWWPGEWAEIIGAEWEISPVYLLGAPGVRTDWWGATAEWLPPNERGHTSRYEVIAASGWHYELQCTAYRGEPPSDHWLSIAEAFEFLAAG